MMLTFLAPKAEAISPSIPGRSSTQAVSCFALGMARSSLRVHSTPTGTLPARREQGKGTPTRSEACLSGLSAYPRHKARHEVYQESRNEQGGTGICRATR
jgi:hypothetical protein